jgi:transposase
MVARQYDVNANQVFSWRKRYREASDQPSGRSAPQLIPVVVTADRDAAAEQPPENIEIDVAGKYRVRVGCGFDGPALRRLLDVLERR